MENNLIVVVVLSGVVSEVYSTDASAKIVIVDQDNQAADENIKADFTWPDTQFDEERVQEPLGEDYES